MSYFPTLGVSGVTDYVDPLNSSVAPLAANATFTGTAFNALNYNQINVFVYANASSAQDGVQLQFSSDNVNWDHIHSTTFTIGDGKSVQSHIHAKYCRVVFINGPTLQTAFRLQAVFKPIATNGSVVEVKQAITKNDDCVLTKSVVTGNSGTDIFTDAKVNVNGSQIVAFDSSSMDAFGRLRVSIPYTLFDSQHRYRDNGKWSNAITGTAAATYNANESCINMTVDASSGASVIRESKTVQHYQPGKSLVSMMTFVMSPSKVNLTQRVGYFGAQNGAYFEDVNGTYNMVLRSYVTGSIVETRIPQIAWSGDKLNGNGTSRKILDASKSNIFVVNLEWLGAGLVNCGFVIDGVYINCHTFLHSNISTTTYMTTACLPSRMEIFNVGVTSGTSTMKQICTTVMSEGGYSPHNLPFSISTPIAAPINLVSAGIWQPIVSIRLNSARLDSIVLPSSFSGMIQGSTVQYAAYKIVINPALTGATWVTSSSGNVDYDISATSFIGGTDGHQGYIDPRSVQGDDITNFNYQLGRTLAGVSDIITVVAAGSIAGVPVCGTLSWMESI